MKLTAFALILSAAPALAGGPVAVLDDPEVMKPAATWSGPYVGLSYGRVTSTAETVECFKLGQPKACDDPIFAYYPEYKVEVRTQTETSDSSAGVLLGYRFDMGRVVPGVELALQDGGAVPGINLGLDLGNLLPYAHLDRDGAALGIEARLSPRLTAGVRAGKAGASITVGWGW
jgi:hypothetical protein